jgi:magnesium chelatase family protein
VEGLGEVVSLLRGEREIEPLFVDMEKVFQEAGEYPEDFRDVKGQEHAKRAWRL